MKDITIELYDREHEFVDSEEFDKESLIFAIALGENWELAEKGNYYLTIM